MYSGSRIALFILLVLGLSACNSHDNQVDPEWTGYQDTLEANQEVFNVPETSRFDEPNEWPDYIPDEIPEFKASIRNVMGGGGRIRIFYQDVTRKQLDAYLRELEQMGYQLTYQVYIQEGFPDNSEERIKKGDFDAVDITNGMYHMNIAYGEGDISYDIDTDAFADAIPTPAGLEWPADLLGVVPKPERCLIDNVAPDGRGGYTITCIPQDEAVRDDYITALNAAGYLPRESHIVSASGVYGRDDLDISVDQHSTAMMMIQIWRADPAKTTWPADLAGIVPQPEGCKIANVSNFSPGNYLISCKNEGGQMAVDYLNRLLSMGFNETNRMESQTGALLSSSLEKDKIRVQLMTSDLSGLVINITIGP